MEYARTRSGLRCPIDDNSGLFDADLRKEIVHGINIHTELIETDISDQLRRHRIKTAAVLTSVVLAGVLLVAGVNAYRTYVENNTFTIRAEDITITTNKRYTFAVSQNGEFLVDAFLIVNEPVTRDGQTYYQIEQIAPDANDTYYWSVREDGFYQYLDLDDAYPQIFIPFPLRPAMKWKASTYPNDRYSYSKQPVDTHFTAGQEVTLDLPIGPVVCIEISATGAGGTDAITIWMAKEAPIAKLIVDPDDPAFVAELSNIDFVTSR